MLITLSMFITVSLNILGIFSNVRTYHQMNTRFIFVTRYFPELHLTHIMMNILHTYRGDINDTCHCNPSWLCKNSTKMYTKAIVSEDYFNAAVIPKDQTVDSVEVFKPLEYP